MKIGIVTFYRVANYGAMLQAYALWQYLAARGHEVVFVAHEVCVGKRPSFWRCCVSRRFSGIRAKMNRYVRFPITTFAANYPQTGLCQTIEEVREATRDCDVFIVGSDQMWNPMWCSGRYLPLVMLDFVASGKKRVSYAVSFATAVWRQDQNAALAGELIKKFDMISVREESGVELVRELSGRTDVICLPDPTLLQPVDLYRKIASLACCGGVGGDRYIFRYILDEWDDAESSQKIFAFVQSRLRIARVETDRIPVQGWLGLFCRLIGVTSKVDVPVWIFKLSNADFVFTNSFHGTVFSILFHRPFVALLLRGPMSGMNERLLSLLTKLGLSERAVYADEVEKCEKAIATSIQWDTVDGILQKFQTQADAFFSVRDWDLS